MWLIEFENFHVRAIFSDDGGNESLHFERDGLANHHYVELVLRTLRYNFVLRPGLVYLVSRRLQNESARGQEALIPSGTQNLCHMRTFRSAGLSMNMPDNTAFCGQP